VACDHALNSFPTSQISVFMAAARDAMQASLVGQPGVVVTINGVVRDTGARRRLLVTMPSWTVDLTITAPSTTAPQLQSAIDQVIQNVSTLIPPEKLQQAGIPSDGVTGHTVAATTACPTGTPPGTDNCVCKAGDGGATCATCLAGTFSAGGAGAVCKTCVGESIAASTGASRCTACTDGRLANEAHTVCRIPPTYDPLSGPEVPYTAHRRARLHVDAPGIMAGISASFPPLTPTLAEAVAAASGAVDLSPSGAFVFTPPRDKSKVLVRVNFKIADANGDALSRTALVTVLDKAPPLGQPLLGAFEVSAAAGQTKTPGAKCGASQVTATVTATAGLLDLVKGDKKKGAPRGLEVQFATLPTGGKAAADNNAGAAASPAAACIARLPDLKLAASQTATDRSVPCVGCGRCLERLGLSWGDSVSVSVRARKDGGYPASAWSAAKTIVL
jgi:hypothetical protein